MYFTTAQYPALKGMAKKDRNRTVSAALNQHGKWVDRRLGLAILIFAVASYLFVHYETRLGLPGWIAPVFFLGNGLILSLYVLWEINAGLYEAVSKYTHKT